MSYFTAGKHRRKRWSKQSDAGRAVLTDPVRRSMIVRESFSSTMITPAPADRGHKLGSTPDALALV